MKIVHLCLCGPMTDGFGYQENILAKYHRKMGYEISVITSEWVWGNDGKIVKSGRHQYINSDDVQIIRLQIKKGTVHSKFKRYPALYTVLEQEAADVLFVHGAQFLDIDRVVRYLKKHSSVTAYVDNHADFSNSATNWVSKNILHKIIWKYCEHEIEPYTKKFYGVLPVRVDFLKNVYKLPAEKCELLVMGADDELVEKAKVSGARERIRAQYGIAENEFLVMTGGKINSKRPETVNLMRAVIELQRQDVKLLIFGTVADELKTEFDGMCADEHIIYVGWLKASETYSYFVAADLVVFPGLHSVMWEQAVAQGKPCIFRDIEGFHHVDIGGNADFVSDVSVAGLKKALTAIINDPAKYQAMRSAAEEKGMQAFSYKEIARRSIQ